MPFEEIKIITIVMLPLFILLFFISLGKLKYSKELAINKWILILYSSVILILHFANIIHFMNIVIMHYLIMLVTIVNILIVLLKLIKRKKYKSIILTITAICFLLSLILDIFVYSKLQGFLLTTLATKGLIAFTIMYYYIAIKEITRVYENEKEREIYKKLAFTDGLTGLKNRLAFEEKMNYINRNLSLYKGNAFFVFDLNNLKLINDTMGHSSGDKYIIKSIIILNEVLGEFGDIYRIGGDEFVFIGEHYFDIEATIDILKDKLKICYNNEIMGIAYGYKKITEEYDDIYDVYSLADNEMYKNKITK